MKHKSKIKGFTHKELAENIGDLYYDSLTDLLNEISDKILKDSKVDLHKGRLKLAHELSEASDNIKKSSKNIKKAWRICKPFINHRSSA